MHIPRLIRTLQALALGGLLATGAIPALANPQAPAATPAPAAPPPLPIPSPSPRLGGGQAVDWWFAYKFNSSSFPSQPSPQQTCRFGGGIQPASFSQHYAVASSLDPILTGGPADDLGESPADPLGATFAQVWEGGFNYVVWNDQFEDPKVKGDDSWAHSKGLLAWNDAGEGFVLQVSTPSWPGSASTAFPRASGNTLGCIAKPNNVMYAQHFFALKLTHEDLLKVLEGLRVASVRTADPALADLPASDPAAREAHELIRNGGPADVRAAVDRLGRRDKGTSLYMADLSSGFRLIVKPSDLNVPPWQMISAVLGVPLRTATWWASPRIPSTAAGAGAPGCWDASLGQPGEVQVAKNGAWDGKTISLINGGSHAKLGVSLEPAKPWVIFGDMNQQGQLAPKIKNGKPSCASSQNGRGGLFFAIQNPTLHASLAALMAGETEPYTAP